MNGPDWYSEKGRDAQSGNILVAISPCYFRPTEVNILQGDASKARRVLGWKPDVNFYDLVKIMLHYDIEIVKKEIIA